MKTMWKKARGMVCAGGLAVIYLTGCGKDVPDTQGRPVQESQQDNTEGAALENKESAGFPETGGTLENGVDNDAADGTASGSINDGEFFDGANLHGSVVEFSDEGFTLSPATTEKEEGGGEIMEQAAPGSESDENNIQITYSDNTVFQIVNLSITSQSEVSREDADKESIKKQSSVCVFGSCQDTYHWTADKILILTWQ